MNIKDIVIFFLRIGLCSFGNMANHVSPKEQIETTSYFRYIMFCYEQQRSTQNRVIKILDDKFIFSSIETQAYLQKEILMMPLYDFNTEQCFIQAFDKCWWQKYRGNHEQERELIKGYIQRANLWGEQNKQPDK